MKNTDNPKNVGAYKGQSVPVNMAPTIVKSSKSLICDRRKKNLCKMEKIHFHLRKGYIVPV